MLQQQLILDRYRIIGKAGSGGYATVQHAFDTRLKRDVAIKCIRITRADVDAAKRTAAMLRQIDPAAQNRSIPIGSSRVIPAGGKAAARIRKETAKSVYGRSRQGQTAFGSVDGVRAGALPEEPTFLSKREERLSQGRRGRRGARAADLTAAKTVSTAEQDTAPVAADADADENSALPDHPLISKPRDIPSLADMLPGAIRGAGETKIASVDSDAVSINLDLDELWEEQITGQVDAPLRQSEQRGAFDAPSFLEAMDAEELERWRGSGEPQDAAYYRNLALGGVLAVPTDADGAARPSVAAVQQWQERAQEQQRHEEAARARGVRRGQGQGADPAEATRPEKMQQLSLSQAITPEDLAALDTVPGLEEARTAAHLNDANIVTVYDCVVEGDTAYVIMEYVEGKTLARVLRDLGDEVTLDMVGAVFASVSHALEVAHKAGVLHLDIKPENVIVNREGVVKVTDFGLSTLMDGSGQGSTGGGTIGYMPLEQMRRQPLDVRTDEWALASLTYEMLSGSNPFRARTLAEAELAIEDAEIILPSRCWDGMSEKVDDVMFTALAPDAEDRYDSVSAFSKALANHVGNAKEGKRQLADVVGISTAELHGVAGDGAEAEPAPKRGLFGGLFGRGAKSVDEDAGAAAKPMAKAASSAERRESEERPEREPREPRQPRAPRQPFIDRLGVKGASLMKRLFAGMSAAVIAMVALLNFRLLFDVASGGSSMPDTTFGLFSTAPIVAWIVLAAFVVVALLMPRVGFLVAFGAFAVSLMFSQAWTAALLLLVSMGAWWWFIGRRSDGACTLVMMQPLLGAFGFAGVVPVLAGALLDVKEALSVAAASAASAMVFAALGSYDLANWDVLSNFIVAVNPVIAGASITNGLVVVFAGAQTWITAVSWVAAAGLFALCCRRGTKAFDMVGAVLAGAVIVSGMLVVPALMGAQNALSPLAVAGAVVPALLGVVFALANVTDRVRMAEGEW